MPQTSKSHSTEADRHCSRMDRIRRPHSLSTSDAQLDTGRLRRPDPAHLGRSRIVRCHNIHGARPDYHAL